MILSALAFTQSWKATATASTSRSRGARFFSITGKKGIRTPRLALESVMAVNVANDLDSVHPQMLKAAITVDPQRLWEDARREIGQCLEWAIEQARTEKKAVSTDCQYSDQTVIGAWIAGRERVQLDKLKVSSRKVYVEFLLALLQAEEGVEVKTQVTLRRVG